jgi:6-phospho-beta-glucosidase
VAGVKIAVIGGGSTYTPELVEGFARRADVLAVDELVLHDPDAERLAIVAGLATRILNRAGFPGRLGSTGDLAAAVDGASAVLIQLRVGGQQARLVDETLPDRFGLVGQETTGPGGFAKALRTVPVVLGIAEEIRKRALADAWVLDFTNPVGIVTRALLDDGHRAIGLCNVAIGLQRRLARHFGVSPDRVALGHAGLNHLTWLRSVEVDGRDRTAELLANPLLADEVEMPPELLRVLGAVPSYYLTYFYFTGQQLERQKHGGHRAAEVMELERRLLELYADPALDHKPDLLEHRGGAYYSEAAAALVTSLLTGDGARHYVNVRNCGTIAGLPDDAVVEVPALVDRDGARPVPVPDLPPEMLGLVQGITGYEELTQRAARTGDRDVALRALLAHPLVRQWDVAVPLLDALLEANRVHLPQFFAAGAGA